MTLLVIGGVVLVVVVVVAYFVWRAEDPKWRMTRKNEDDDEKSP